MDFLTNFTCIIVTTFDWLRLYMIEAIVIAILIKIIHLCLNKRYGSLDPKITISIVCLIPFVIFIANQFDYLICDSAMKQKEAVFDEKTGVSYIHTKGVFINKSDILTTSAINNSCKSIRVLKNNNGKKQIFDTKILKTLDNSKGSITFLRSNAKNEFFAIVASDDLVKDQEVLIAKSNKSLTKSVIEDYDPGIYSTEFYSNDSRPGNSGAPIYNRKGYIVGILWGGDSSNKSSSGGGNMTIATSLKAIKALANKNDIQLYSIKDDVPNLVSDESFYKNLGAKIFCDKSINAQFGSGVFVNENTVMTNYHVVKNCGNLEILSNKRKFSAKMIAYLSDSDGDIAFLRTKKRQRNFALVSYYSAQSSSDVFFPDFVTAKPTSSRFRIGKGRISFVGQKQSLLTIQDRKITMNDMGAPIFNKKGFLVGIIQGQSLGFGKQATPVNSIISSALLSAIPLYSYDSKEFKTKPNLEQISDSIVDIYCLK